MKTFMLRKEDVSREWYTIDATDKILGRVASAVATQLIGKKKATYTPHVDNGDYVVVLNAEKIAVTGNKLLDKKYYRHSGYRGGLRTKNLSELLIAKPTEALRLAVKGMLPKNKLANEMLRRLRVCEGDVNPHAAQTSKVLDF